MLTIMPRTWYSWDFTVADDARTVAVMDLSKWREKGVLTIDGLDHRVFREGMMSGDFLLEREGTVLARAVKPSAFSSTLLVRYQDREYTLRKKSVWGRSFVVLAGVGPAGSAVEQQVGSLAPAGLMTRKAHVDLPAAWSLALRVFIIWLTVIMWKRDAGAAGA
jgi:hypothetical protein